MLSSAALIVFPGLMAYAAASDLFTMTIPNRIAVALCASFAVFALWSGMPGLDLLLHLGAGLLVLAVSFAFFAFGWIGGGDAKLAAATALWFGFSPLFDYLLLSAVGGGLLTLALLSFRSLPLPRFALGQAWIERLHDRQTGIPYGIALAVAALALYPRTPLWALLATA